MQKVAKIWMDGKYIAWEKANTHILTHALHYGGAVFEGIRLYKTEKGSAIFRLKEHLERLLYSASVLSLKISFSKKDLTEAIIGLIKINKITSGYIRPLIYYGYGKMGLNPDGAPVKTAIAVWPWGSYLGNEAIKVKISSIMRIHPKSTFSAAKISGTYYNSMLASLEAHKEGYQEAILLDFKGNIAEGPGENLFIVKKGVLITPKAGNILKGITRSSILTLAHDLGLKTKVMTVSRRQLMQADEAFFTGTAAEISPIASVNNKKIGKGAAGPLTQKLKTVFTQIVHGENPNYEKWLTFVK